MIPALALVRLDPPLDPSGDEARRQLRRELVRPEYYEDDVIGRLTRWLDRLISGTVDAASGSSGLTTATTTYAYQGGLIDRKERSFLGFRTVKQTLPCLSGESSCLAMARSSC